jgi:hypothetical protein
LFFFSFLAADALILYALAKGIRYAVVNEIHQPASQVAIGLVLIAIFFLYPTCLLFWFLPMKIIESGSDYQLTNIFGVRKRVKKRFGFMVFRRVNHAGEEMVLRFYAPASLFVSGPQFYTSVGPSR